MQLNRRSSVQMQLKLCRPGPKMLAVIESLQTCEKIGQICDHLLNGMGFLEVFHMSTGFRTRITQTVQAQHGLIAKTHPRERKLSILYSTRASNDTDAVSLKRRVFNYVHEFGHEFAVIGVNDGMSPDVLGSEYDVSLRHLAESTPIYVKRDSLIPDDDDVLRWVIVVDTSKDSRHSFDTVLPLIREESEVHLIYLNVLHSHSALMDSSGGREVFKEYTDELNVYGVEKIHTHVSNEPNATRAVQDYVGSLKKVHFLCVPTDNLKVDDPNKKILGSLSDFCVKRMQCTVILPRCH